MAGCALLWSSAGALTRMLETAQGFELSFWRSFFCAVAMVLILSLQERGRPLGPVIRMGWIGLFSGLMWAVMFTCFMVALTWTSVANTLLVIGLSPLLAALLARVVLGQTINRITWIAIIAAGVGIWWMVHEAISSDGLTGILIALGVPLASAINLVTLRRVHAQLDLAPAVLLGALLSCAATLPLAWPLTAGARDLAILAILGAFQLALPCWLMVRALAWLAPHEVALIALLEVVLGPLWAWLFAGEITPAATLQGGVIVLAALIVNTLASRGTAR
ncbi:MAG: DMT family transporter [Betaproteobacteria bacterium]|nr:DMT family transporter [Betaproteobacteria bacterium]